MNEPESIETLGSALPKEIKRCQELLADYKALGPVGSFGHASIAHEIELAHKAMMECDVVAMFHAYLRLKECK